MDFKCLSEALLDKNAHAHDGALSLAPVPAGQTTTSLKSGLHSRSSISPKSERKLKGLMTIGNKIKSPKNKTFTFDKFLINAAYNPFFRPKPI